MLTARDKSQPQKCGECGAELPGGRVVVHCTHRRSGVSPPRVHHGRWRWRCPVCERELGCDECAGRFASEVACDRCHVYADGKPAIELSVEERRVLIEFVPHSTPARAIPLSRLAYEVCGDENQVKETINSLRRKGIVIDQINGRYYLRPRAETTAVQNVQAIGGIELSLPLGDRT